MGGDSGGGRHKKQRKGKRLGVRMDMTPMVDIAFLLLTFFMLTTVFSRPQAMEINLPDSEEEVKIRESVVLSLRGSDDGNIYWNMGTDPFQKITYAELGAVINQQHQLLGDDLIAIIKVDRQGTYNNIVDMLDEIKLAGVTKFSIAPFTSQDSTLVIAARAGA